MYVLSADNDPMFTVCRLYFWYMTLFTSPFIHIPSHTKDFKNGSDACLHGTYDEVGTTKYNWSARCQYNVTGWVSMWACDMLSQ